MSVTSKKDQLSGRAKEAVGQASDNDELERQGKAERMKSDLEELAETIRKAFRL